MIFDNNILYNFQQITKFGLYDFVKSYNDFLSQDYPLFVDYFQGTNVSISSESLNNYKTLLDKNTVLRSVIKLNNNRFVNAQYWDLITYLEDIDTKLKTTSKISKYLRSSKTNFNFNSTSEHISVLGVDQSLEDLVNTNLKTTDDSVVNSVALKNDLLEKDYTIEGGHVIKFNLLVTDKENDVTTIIDNPNINNLAGLDLPVYLTYDKDDLSILSYIETLNQTVNILASLKKGDLILLYGLGLDNKASIGSNVNILKYKNIIENLAANFASDDFFRGIKIVSVTFDQGDLFIVFNVYTKTGVKQEKTIIQ